MKLKLTTAFLSVFLLTGCPPEEGTDYKNAEKSEKKSHGHEHGPNDGELSKINDDVMVEFVHDEKAKKATIYLLDADKKPMPSDAKMVTVKLVEGEDSEELFMFYPVTQDGEEAGKASKFEMKEEDRDEEEHLSDDVHEIAEGEYKAFVIVPIDGKDVEAKLNVHHEEHEGHDHDKKKEGEKKE